MSVDLDLLNPSVLVEPPLTPDLKAMISPTKPSRALNLNLNLNPNTTHISAT